MSHCQCESRTDFGSKPYVTNVMRKAEENTDYRRALWTGCHVQMTIMCIPVGSDIGLEIHPDTDQIIRVERGMALVKMGAYENRMESQTKIFVGDAVFVPAGIWHNVINIGRMPLKLSTVYAPPHHPAGTVHHTRKDAEKAHY